MHYDQVCLSGLACTLGGDRSLADFFAIALDPTTGRLVIVYDEDGKLPDGVNGPVAIPNVLVQNTGPSNLGGTVSTRREVIRTSSADPAGDAQSPYSFSTLVNGPAPPPASRTNRPALDITSVAVGPEVNPDTGKLVSGGGFTMTLKVKDLSDSALTSALTGTNSVSLIWAFRWINGYQPAALSVHWMPALGFDGGFDSFATGSATCLATPGVTGYDPKCLTYPGSTSVPMKVDQAKNTITMSAPRSVLKALGALDSHGRPTLVAATKPGTSRFYSGAAFSMGSATIPQVQTFLTPVDGAAAFDFVLPAGSGSGGGGGSGGGSGGGGSGGGGSGSGSIPTTGGLGWPLLALVTVLAAALAVRLRRNYR
jgi:uncharacterized membrane protein YgcG